MTTTYEPPVVFTEHLHGTFTLAIPPSREAYKNSVVKQCEDPHCPLCDRSVPSS